MIGHLYDMYKLKETTCPKRKTVIQARVVAQLVERVWAMCVHKALGSNPGNPLFFKIIPHKS